MTGEKQREIMNGSPRDQKFPTTSWTIVTRSKGEGKEAERAMTQLCERYWYPAYAFIRRAGLSPEDSADLTQNFFSKVYERVEKADPNRGKLRSFFMTILRNDVNQFYRNRSLIKNGGKIFLESLDASQAEDRYQREPIDTQKTPEEFYDFVWARELLETSLNQVGEEWTARGQGETFQTIKPLVLRPIIELDPETTRESACRTLDITSENLRRKLKDIRDRLKKFVADEVRRTVAEDSFTDRDQYERRIAEEVAHIFTALTISS